MQVSQFESLRGQTADFWLEFIDKYFLNTNSVTIIGKPSESLMQSISDEEKSRVEDRKKTLGKKGLNNLKRTVDNAIAQNDVKKLLVENQKRFDYIFIFNLRAKMYRTKFSIS